MLPPMTRALLIGALLVLCVGCEPSIPEGVFECDVDEDCPPEQRCDLRLSRCFTPDGG